jgi:PAS domain S-box-containing protein
MPPAPQNRPPLAGRMSSDTREDLRQNDQPYRLLFDANPQPMWVFDRVSKRMLAVNTAALARYGHSREAFLQLNALDIRRSLQGQRMTAAQVDEDPIEPSGLRSTTRWKHALKNGCLIDVEITSSDLLWEGQSARLVVVNEITEHIDLQRQAEQAQRETDTARVLLNLVINRVSDAIFALDKALRFTYLNAPALHLLRRERAEQLIGRHIWDEYELAHALVVHGAYARAMQTQQIEVFQSFYAPWDKWYEVRVFPSSEGLSIFCSDITQRKLSEQRLVSQEREFRVLAEQMPALIYRSGLEPPFRATYLSPYLLTLGHTVSEWLADPQAWANALHPDDRERVMQTLSQACAQGREQEIEYRLRDAQGLWRHFCDRSRWIDPSDGSPAYLQGIALDVTDLVESAQALRASEASLRRSELRYRLAAASGQVWDWDIAQDRLNFSPDFWQQLGFEPVSAAACGNRLSAITHPGDLPRHQEALRRHLKDRAPFGVEVRIGDARGAWRWMQIQGQAQWDDTGRAIFMAGTTVDITPRKKAEAALRESEAYRRSLFEQLSDGVLLIDNNNRILDANRQAMDMVGYPGEQLFIMSLRGLLADQSPQRSADTLLADHSPHLGPLLEWNIARRDGTRLLVEVSTRALDATRYIAVLRDITDRRAAETTLVTYQIELSELTQRLLTQEKNTTQRVAQALHDNLGQSLAVARLHLDALLITAGDTLPPALAEQCQHLASVLAQAVLDVRNVLADLRPPLLEEQGLAAALDNETRMAPMAVGADVLLEVAEGLNRQRWPSDVEYSTFMVVREAIANARLHAQASLIRVLLGGDEHRLAVDVIDDGAGISADMKQGRPGHLGIVGMRERAISIGARFAIQAEPGGGTRVCLHWQEPGS